MALRVVRVFFEQLDVPARRQLFAHLRHPGRRHFLFFRIWRSLEAKALSGPAGYQHRTRSVRRLGPKELRRANQLRLSLVSPSFEAQSAKRGISLRSNPLCTLFSVE